MVPIDFRHQPAVLQFNDHQQTFFPLALCPEKRDVNARVAVGQCQDGAVRMFFGQLQELGDRLLGVLFLRAREEKWQWHDWRHHSEQLKIAKIDLITKRPDSTEL